MSALAGCPAATSATGASASQVALEQQIAALKGQMVCAAAVQGIQVAKAAARPKATNAAYLPKQREYLAWAARTFAGDPSQ